MPRRGPVATVPVSETARISASAGSRSASSSLGDGRFLLAWVQTDPDLKTGDYYYRFVCDFDFAPAAL